MRARAEQKGKWSRAEKEVIVINKEVNDPTHEVSDINSRRKKKRRKNDVN